MTLRTAAVGGPRRPSSSAAFAWGLRILLLAAAGAALSFALVERSNPEQPGATFVCPMHSQIRSPISGRCPICNMALVSMGRAAGPAGAGRAALAPGDLTTVRAHLFSLPTRAPAWIDGDGTAVALLYRDEAQRLAVGASGTFAAARAPEAAAPVTLDDAPPRGWDAEMVQLRFRFDGPPPARPGDIGQVALALPPRPVLVVDEDLVFTGEGGRYVLVPTPDGLSVEPRPVEIGRVINGRAVVVAGLADGERVVRRRAFFLDADRRFRQAPAAESASP